MFTESVFKDTALVCVEMLAYDILYCVVIATGEAAAERQDYIWLRDTQLPKLISGELRVNRFEAAMKTVP